MKQYLELLNRVLTEGVRKEDRTGTGTISVFGHQMRFNLEEGFPLLTTKKLHLKSIIYELVMVPEWRYQRKISARSMAYASGTSGPMRMVALGIYTVINGGHGRIIKEVSIDQITEAVETIKHNPDSRRIIVSAWNVADLRQHEPASLPRFLPVLRGERTVEPTIVST